MDFSGKNTGMGSHFLLQVIFLTRDRTRFFTIELPGKSWYACIHILLPSLTFVCLEALGRRDFLSFNLWVCFHFALSLDSTYQWDAMVFSFSVWLISLSIIPSRSICFIVNCKISFFYGWVIFHCKCTLHHLYPLIYRWALRLLPYHGYGK